ncbi:hypothetical protein ACFE04_028565 [Oxalis oulophora]
MVRSKVNLAYLTNTTTRKATYRKRGPILMKKVSELSTLCGVAACGIVFKPDDPEPHLWPSSGVARQVIRRFKMVPEEEREKNMVVQDGEVEKRNFRLTTELDKKLNANREKELKIIMCEGPRNREVIKDFQLGDLKQLQNNIEKALEHINMRFELMMANKTNNEASSSRTSTIRASSPTLQDTSVESDSDQITANNNSNIASSSSLPPDFSDDAESDMSDEDSE